MRNLLLAVCCTSLSYAHAQQDSSTYAFDQLSPRDFKAINRQRIRPCELIFPLSLVTYGVFSQANEDMRDFDNNIKNVVRRDPDFHTPIDNYLQYVPGLAVYGLNAIGIKGKHNFRDRTIIYVMANLMMSATVESIKSISKVPRPEGFGTNAFPSGHTATAFVGAEFLRQEYKDVSPWYGVAGYAAAASTGILRMYNNMHWFRDVMAGAGIGILSTRVAYWLEPLIAKKIFHTKGDNLKIPAY